jgi:NADPH:quinone reductase-like Zn-dependent oxidoreductase
MRVITQSEFGTPDVLTVAEVPRPVPLPTEVLVKVQAAGVNPVDRKTREGGGMAAVLGEPPFVLGWDVAGVVEEVGFGVTTLAVGDRVFGMPWFPRAAGGYGQFVTAPARQFAKVPDNLSIEEAAAVPLAALTAWQALVDTAKVQPGQTVVVTAAGGGVGHFAVQFAHHLGANVIAVASERHREWLTAHGAATVIDYTSVRFEQHIRDADVVIELVGDDVDATTTRSVDVLRPGGLLVAVPAGVPEASLAAAEAAGSGPPGSSSSLTATGSRRSPTCSSAAMSRSSWTRCSLSRTPRRRTRRSRQDAPAASSSCASPTTTDAAGSHAQSRTEAHRNPVGAAWPARPSHLRPPSAEAARVEPASVSGRRIRRTRR